MKIGLSTSVIQRGKSGVGQYVLALARALLDETAHEFTLFVLEEDRPHFAFAEGRMRIVTVPERHRPPVKDILWHQLELPGLARRLGLDVLHVPSYRRLLWRHPCALVGTIHDLAPYRFPEKYDWMRMVYGRTVVRRLAHRQDEIIAVSRTTANDIARFFGMGTGRISVIHNGLDHTRFTPGRGDAAATIVARRHDVRPPFFLYVARLEHPAKNHTRLIAAFNHFKTRWPSPWQLVLCGGDWHGAAVIHDQVRRSPFAADIRCTGFVPDTELPTWYQAASVFIYPTLFEGFGLPPLEAMACGCPVLASRLDAIEEVCGDAAGWINASDVDDLSRQMIRIASDHTERERLRAAGLARARQFDWRTTAAATLRVYERARQRQRAPVVASPLPHTAT